MNRPAGAIVIRWLLPVLGAAGAAAAIAAMSTSDQRVTNYAQVSRGVATATLAAGLGPVAAGTFAVWDRTIGPAGQLTIAAGLGWFASMWTGWTAGPELVRSLGMIVAPLVLPALVHLVISYPSGRGSTTWSRVAIGVGWLAAGGVSVTRAVTRDPFLDPYCWNDCTGNAFLIVPNPELARVIDQFWLRFVLVTGAVTLGIAGWRLARAGRVTRAAWSLVVVPAAAAAGGYAAYATALLRDPAEDPTRVVFRSIHIAQAIALSGLAIGLAWAVVRARRRRSAVARLADDLGVAPPPGSLQSALARTLGDESLRVSYWLPGSQRYVDAAGRPITLQSSPGRAATSVVRHGQPVALVEHDAGLYDAAELEDQIGSAARLAIDNERLAAEVQARMEDLRSSRMRIVEAADLARRQLERDLHDGAQQRLLAFTYQLRLARAATTDPELAATLNTVLAEAQTALAELRELANGIFPAILDEAGLDAALWSLAEEATYPLEITAVPPGRLPAAVERAAYLVVAGTVQAATSSLSIAMTRLGDRLVVEVGGTFGALPEDLADRLSALSGTLGRQAGGLRAEIPCGQQDPVDGRAHANRRG
ncbi:sensor histidine kinase [Kribbella sp. NBC_00889]|uniref:sensor histidine kinase n=1 Tax=Kribbella sp. NBC_00889 TaxID=2975974 RepID=UPI003868591C|nr:histidine kinase [Kribbella sp. NBC_00889]